VYNYKTLNKLVDKVWQFLDWLIERLEYYNTKEDNPYLKEYPNYSDIKHKT